MREYYSKIAALVVAGVLSFNAHANEATDVGTERQLTCLAQNIYHEAGTESVDGKIAVAQVTINRANSGKFPSTICGVVHQKTSIAGKLICQFSWVCTPTGKVKYLSDAWQESLTVAQRVLYEELRLEKLNEALYFHAAHANPNWGLERITRIGNHVFYSSDHVKKKVSNK